MEFQSNILILHMNRFPDEFDLKLKYGIFLYEECQKNHLSLGQFLKLEASKSKKSFFQLFWIYKYKYYQKKAIKTCLGNFLKRKRNHKKVKLKILN